MVPCVAIGAPLVAGSLPQGLSGRQPRAVRTRPPDVRGAATRFCEHTALCGSRRASAPSPRKRRRRRATIYRGPILVADGLGEDRGASSALSHSARRAGRAGPRAIHRISRPARLPLDAVEFRRCGRQRHRARRPIRLQRGRVGPRYTLERTLRDSGPAVRRNQALCWRLPSPSDTAPRHKGRHAVQIEINRALYIDERRIVKLEKAEDLAKALLNM